jgi:hypothetical protein
VQVQPVAEHQDVWHLQLCNFFGCLTNMANPQHSCYNNCPNDPRQSKSPSSPSSPSSRPPLLP